MMHIKYSKEDKKACQRKIKLHYIIKGLVKEKIYQNICWRKGNGMWLKEQQKNIRNKEEN